jgi:tyrosine-protein kinase
LTTERRGNGAAPALSPSGAGHAHDESPRSRVVDLETVARVWRRRRWLIILCVVIATASTLAYDLTRVKQYSATATLLFRDPGFDQKFFGAQVLAPSVDPEREQETNVGLVSLQTVAARTAAALGPRLGSRVFGEVSVSGVGNANLATITATDPNPRIAARIANAYATQYVAFRRAADRQTVLNAKRLVEDRLAALPPSQRSGPTGSDLANQAAQLEVLADLQTGNAEFVQRALAPSSPSSPTPRRDGIIAGIVGLLLGLGLAITFERADRRLNDPEELEEAYQLPLLGLVPRSPAYVYPKKQLDRGELLLPPAEVEAFRLLRARLRYFNLDRELKVVLVTSAAPGEGKTTVALHLAAAAASRGAKVILVEADLRRPTLRTRLRLGAGPGLLQILTDSSSDGSMSEASVADASVFVDTDKLNGPGTGFYVLTAGGLPPNSAEVLESAKMAKLLEVMRQTADLVVIDSTPLPVVSDAIPLTSRADGVLVVSRLGVATRVAAKRMRDQMNQLHISVLGIIANGLDAKTWGYYGDQYDYVPAPVTEVDEVDESQAGQEGEPADVL